MTESEIFVGLGLLLALAVGYQIAASTLRLPAIVVLLPVGFVAGNLTTTIDPNELSAESFTAMVSLAVAVILFEGGLDLGIRELEGHSQRIVRRLITWSVSITWATAGFLASLRPIRDRTLPRRAAVRGMVMHSGHRDGDQRPAHHSKAPRMDSDERTDTSVRTRRGQTNPVVRLRIPA